MRRKADGVEEMEESSFSRMAASFVSRSGGNTWMEAADDDDAPATDSR
jgi:hypothetical protein